MTDKEKMMLDIGTYCKEFRKHNLGLTLTEFSQVGRHNIKNVCAFESGLANNIEYLFFYYRKADDEDRVIFAREIFNIL